jgi:hypothetical protein
VGDLKPGMNDRGTEDTEGGGERRKTRSGIFAFFFPSFFSLCPLCLCGLMVFLVACGGGGATPTPVALTAQQTALAQLTSVPGGPAAPAIATAVPTRQASPVTAPAATAPSASAIAPVPVTETPGLKPLANGTTYTNPAKTYRIDLPADWSPPASDPAQAGRVVTRAPKDAVALTIEEGPTPDDWTRLMPPVVAGILDAQYRASAPGSTLQSTVLTGIRGVIDSGLPTYHFTYASNANGAPVAVERFVTLTFAGAITVTTTAAPDAATAMRPTIEGIVGSLVPLKLDAPTPAALAPPSGAGMATRTPSGLGLVLPDGWAAIAAPTTPPSVEFAAQNASGDQRVRVVRKAVTDGTKLNDFAATVAGELKTTTVGYEVDAEDTKMIGGARVVRNLYRATVDGKEVVGQSVALIKGANGYVISVEIPAAQYDAKPDDAQALFDRVESSITLP